MSDFKVDERAARDRRREGGERDRRLPPDFKAALPAADLPREVAAALKHARVDTAEAYELDDLPEIDDPSVDGSSRT